MDYPFGEIKNKLINEFWFPNIVEYSKILYPRLKINKKLRVLTLTHDSNHSEIEKLIKDKLSISENIVAWTYSHFKAIRITSDLPPVIVLFGKKFEDALMIAELQLQKYLPFDLYNLDFSTQEPIFEAGRLEREINCIEKVILKQKEEKKEFILIYTTIINSNVINLNLLADESNRNYVTRWPGLILNKYPKIVNEKKLKISCLEELIFQIAKKHGYFFLQKHKTHQYNDNKMILSIAGLLGR